IRCRLSVRATLKESAEIRRNLYGWDKAARPLTVPIRFGGFLCVSTFLSFDCVLSRFAFALGGRSQLWRFAFIAFFDFTLALFFSLLLLLFLVLFKCWRRGLWESLRDGRRRQLDSHYLFRRLAACGLSGFVGDGLAHARLGCLT